MLVVLTTNVVSGLMSVAGICVLLVEAEGSVATASVRREVQVDRKINILVKELCCFNMSITGVSETKMVWPGGI